MLRKTGLLFLAILIEGYVVLATELIAIRQMVPFVGSGVETTAILISGVLLPLAIGYHYGGIAWKRARARARRGVATARTVREILLRNIVVALLFLAFGLSMLPLTLLFEGLTALGVTHRLLVAGFYAALFLVAPLFLLGQTVPLVSHYFSRRRLSEITGRMLFFSTAGAFLGSLLSTLVLMSWIGVSGTVVVTLGLLTLLFFFLRRRRDAQGGAAACVALFALVLLLNAPAIFRAVKVVSENAYNTVQVFTLDEGKTRLLSVNRSFSSAVSSDPEKTFPYIRYINEEVIAPIAKPGQTPRSILVIGAGGFTVGLEDNVNRYVFVDIDPALKDVAERDFLQRKLRPNKSFIATSARAFLKEKGEPYDVIILDLYTMYASIPVESVTREFLVEVKSRLKEGGYVVANIIASPQFRDRFSRRYNATFASVFPVHTRQIVGPSLLWQAELPGAQAGEIELVNTLYIARKDRAFGDATVYTDDRNTYTLDR